VPAAEAAPVLAREAAKLFADIGSLASVILAVSGGPDSTALLFLAARWRAARRKGPKLVAVTVDHGLRPGSAREAAMVKRLAADHHAEHRTVRWMGRKPDTGLQEAARAARYRLLVAAARKAGARHILTAHTRDDQAETVLFRLARGSGLSGLAGIARTSVLDHMTLIRPLLDIPKARLLATLNAAKIPFIEDPSNQDPRFARTRLRQLAPALAREGLDAARLAALARRLARAEQALARATEQALARLCRKGSTEPREMVMDGREFAALPVEIALRVLGRAIGQIGREGPAELGKLERLLAAVLQSGARRSRMRRTLAGAMITADSEKIVVESAPPRRTPAGKANSARSRRGKPVKASFTGRR
jgi:tRNA(Ile)-lysidine synthase